MKKIFLIIGLVIICCLIFLFKGNFSFIKDSGDKLNDPVVQKFIGKYIEQFIKTDEEYNAYYNQGDIKAIYNNLITDDAKKVFTYEQLNQLIQIAKQDFGEHISSNYEKAIVKYQRTQSLFKKEGYLGVAIPEKFQKLDGSLRFTFKVDDKTDVLNLIGVRYDFNFNRK